jgi:DNA modification methylase
MTATQPTRVLDFRNPKVGPANHWYRYYAGYSSDFVTYALENVVPRATSVLDPWNGTGTTSVLAATRRLRTLGYDINPAMVLVAKGRMLHSSRGHSRSGRDIQSPNHHETA